MNYPELVYSRTLENNCIIIKWGESGYYNTDYPKGKYNDNVIDDMNARAGISPEERRAMEICSIAAEHNHNLDWKSHFEMCMRRLKK